MIITILFIVLSYASFSGEVPSASDPFYPAPLPVSFGTNFSQFYPNCTYGGTQTWAGRTIHIYNNCGTVPVIPVNLGAVSVYSTSLFTLPSSLADNVIGLFNVSGTIYLLITRATSTGGAFSFNLSIGNSIRVYTCTACDSKYLLIHQFNNSSPVYNIINSISQTYLNRRNIPGYIHPLSLSASRTFLNESTFIFGSSQGTSSGMLVFFKHSNYSTALFTDIAHFPNTGQNFMGIFYPGPASIGGQVNRSFAPIYLPADYLIGGNASNYVQFSYYPSMAYVNYIVTNITYNNVVFLNDFRRVDEKRMAILNITVSDRSALTSSPVERNYTVYDYVSTVTFRLNDSLFPYSEITVPAELLPRPVQGGTGSSLYTFFGGLNGYVQMVNINTNRPAENPNLRAFIGRISIVHLPGIMELISASNTNVSLGVIGTRRYYLNISSSVDCSRHKVILYYAPKDIFYGSLYDYEVLTRPIERIYLDYRPVSGVVYIQFPRVNKTITNYELQNYLAMFPSFSVSNYVSFGDHVCNFTIANITAELPLFSNISGVNRSNFFNIGEPVYKFSDGERNYSCRYAAGTLYCFTGSIASEFEQYTSYFNTSYITSSLIDIVSKASYLRCIINQYNDSHRSLKFVGLFSVPLNFSIVIRNGSIIDSIYNYTNVSNISATIFFRANQKAEVLSDGVPLCRSYGFFDSLSNIPVVYPFFALIIIGLATVAASNILSLVGLSYLLIEGGLFLGVSINVIAFLIVLFFAIYLLINKPTEDSVRTVLTLGIVLFFALNQLNMTVPEIHDIDNTYFSAVSAKIANKTSALERLANGGWDTLELVSLPGEVVSILLIPFDLLFGLPLLIRDVVNAFWFPVGYYVAQLGTVLLTLGIINLVLRIIEILLNRFRKL